MTGARMSTTVLTNTDVGEALQEAKAAFAEARPAAGGSTSPRSATSPAATPGPESSPTLSRSLGCAARAGFGDEDGNRCIDFLGEATAGIYGHNHPVIRQAVESQLDQGWNFGGHTALEGELAAMLTARFPLARTPAVLQFRHRGQPVRVCRPRG